MKNVIKLGRFADHGGFCFQIIKYETSARLAQVLDHGVEARTDRAYQGKMGDIDGAHVWCFGRYHVWVRLPFDRSDRASGVYLRNGGFHREMERWPAELRREYRAFIAKLTGAGMSQAA